MMTIKNLLVTTLLTALVVTGATAAHADLAVNFSNYADTFSKASTGSDINVVGWKFTATDDLYVNQLGYFDIDNGAYGHDVGLYDSNGSQLAGVTIGANQGVTTGLFRMLGIAAVELAKGHDYILAYTVGDGSYTADVTGTFGGTNTFTDLQFTHVNFLGDVFDSASQTLPTTWTSTEGGAATYGTFGPNMNASSVPEPGTIVLVAAGLAGLAVIRKTRRS